MPPTATKRLLSTALLILLAVSARAEIVRPAPDFVISGGKSLKSFLGQPVVLVIAPSPESKVFRRQIRRLQRGYEGLAARKTIFIAAFSKNNSGVIRSNIPFATAANGARVAADYGATGPICVAVIGQDGNLDLKSEESVPAFRVRDAILNNFTLQAAERPENMGQ